MSYRNPPAYVLVIFVVSVILFWVIVDNASTSKEAEDTISNSNVQVDSSLNVVQGKLPNYERLRQPSTTTLTTTPPPSTTPTTPAVNP